jgi:tetratricopeptide (TPR) repeat protein
MKILLFILIPFGLCAQHYDNASEASELCLAIQVNSFLSDEIAESALDRILSVIGVSKRFILQPCGEISNAVATSYKGLRYILYDKEFMYEIVENTNNWSQLFILAHEVGHHINGHSIDILLLSTDILEPKTLAAKRQQELESDEFAGFILAKLGATLAQTSAAIELLSSDEDDSYSTHPSKSKRLAAIKIGYDKAKDNELPNPERNFKIQSSKEYFYSAFDKSHNGDYYGAIADYTKAIELNPKYGLAFYNRGVSKFALKDNSGAIADYTKAIEINPNDYDAYSNRGVAKKNLQDYYGAIADYTKAIEINPKHDDANYNRSISKYLIGDYQGAISDCTKAIEINPKDFTSYNIRGNSKTALKDNYGAIADYTKAIEINPKYGQAYFNRGICKSALKDNYGAIADYTKAIEINPKYGQAYFNRGICKSALKDNYGAIADYTKAIEINPNHEDSYYSRALAKGVLNDFSGACKDAKKVKLLGGNSEEILNLLCN